VKGAEQDDEGGVGPEAVAEQFDDEDDFRDAVAEEVDGGEQGAAVGEVSGRVEDVSGGEVVGISGEFVFGQRPGDAIVVAPYGLSARV